MTDRRPFDPDHGQYQGGPVYPNPYQQQQPPTGPRQGRPDRELVYVTVSGMGRWEMILHSLLIICTCGFWLPVYWARKSTCKRRSRTYAVGPR